MKQLKMIWDKYIAIFYFMYSVIIHLILFFAFIFCFMASFMFLPENRVDFEWTQDSVRELGGLILLLFLPFLSFIFRFFFLGKISSFNVMLEKKNLLITIIFDIITIFALYLFYFIDNGFSFSFAKGTFLLFFLTLFFFLFFSNFVSILFFSFVQKFRSWKKTKIIKIIFFIIFSILNQFAGVFLLFALLLFFAYFNWDNLSSSLFFLCSFVLVYGILFHIFDSKLYYYLKLIEIDTIVTKMLLLIKNLFFIFIYLCNFWNLE